MYVDPLQFTTVLLRLDSAVVYPNGNFRGQTYGKEWKIEP